MGDRQSTLGGRLSLRREEASLEAFLNDLHTLVMLSDQNMDT